MVNLVSTLKDRLLPIPSQICYFILIFSFSGSHYLAGVGVVVYVRAGGGGDVGGVFSVPNQSVFKKIYVHSGGGVG